MVWLHPTRNPRQRVRGKHRTRYIKDHDLCKKCFQALMESYRRKDATHETT
jgi:hypothetical protein